MLQRHVSHIDPKAQLPSAILGDPGHGASYLRRGKLLEVTDNDWHGVSEWQPNGTRRGLPWEWKSLRKFLPLLTVSPCSKSA